MGMIEPMLMLGGVLLLLFSIRFFSSKKENGRGWKVQKSGDNTIQYSERFGTHEWRSIFFELEMYASHVPRHAIAIPSDWSHYPLWAQDGKEDILARLKKELRQPEYSFLENVSTE